MEIYAFGSVVRGEIDNFSDIDLLILKDINEKLVDIDREKYSIYTVQRLSELWKEGNPFAWHLFIESKCVFTPNRVPFIQSLGKPNSYKNCTNDLLKFYKLFIDSKNSISANHYSLDFDLSMIFLSIRNFASCFALGIINKHEFSRDSALRIGEYSIKINQEVYNSLKQARLLATRAVGEYISEENLDELTNEFPEIEKWFNNLLIYTK